MYKRMLAVAALLATTTACFEIEGRHTIYLRPDGSATWSVVQEEIRVEPGSGEERLDAERRFLREVAAERHVAARSLRELHPAWLASRVLREDAPQAVLTEAEFPGLDLAYRNLFALYGVPGEATLESRDGRTRLWVRFWMAGEDEDEDDAEEDAAEEGDGSAAGESARDEFVLALVLDCRIVLTEGRFVEAEGFEILGLGSVARPLELPSRTSEDAHLPVVLSLTWSAE